MSHYINDTVNPTKSILLQSNDADESYSDSDKTFYLDEVIFTQPDENFIIGVTSFVMPLSVYNINEDVNNTITFETEFGSYQCVLESKNYSASDISEKLTLLLGGQSDLLGGLISVNFDNTNYKFSFSGELNFSIIECSMEKELGIKNQVIENVLNYTALNVCQLGGINNIYIHVENLNINNVDSRGSSSVLGIVPCDSEFGYYVFYTPPEYLYYTITNNTINKLHIRLTDDYNKELLLNGVEWNLTLTLHYQKKRENIINPKFLLDNKNLNLDNQDKKKDK